MVGFVFVSAYAIFLPSVAVFAGAASISSLTGYRSESAYSGRFSDACACHRGNQLLLLLVAAEDNGVRVCVPHVLGVRAETKGENNRKGRDHVTVLNRSEK